MAVSGGLILPDAGTHFLQEDIVDGSVDFKGLPASRFKTGGWRSASFIIGVEVAERFAYYGISSNLISYLTGPLGQSTATAAANVNAWSGTASLLPLLGAFIADSFLGRYRTIVISSLLYTLGLGFLTISAVIPFGSSNCQETEESGLCSPPLFQVIIFFFSLYLVALAQGGHKPCVQAFGADQFDTQDPQECKAKSSFFNWWYFGMCFGVMATLWILNYVQDNLSWGLGFGIPCLVMAFALVVFLSGTVTYRFHQDTKEKDRFVKTDLTSTLLEQDNQEGKKVILSLAPIWATCLVYAIVFSQSSTLFTKQGATMDRSIGGGDLKVPAATLQTFISLSVVIFIPIYDFIFVPFMRSLTGTPSGITMLQRIGSGVFLSVLSMVVAAMVERSRRLQRDVPMSVWWLVPQYVFFGISDVFTMVGLQEFFYDQVPKELKSIGLALYLSIFGIGSFLSSFLISVVEKATGEDGESWFSDDLDRAHLDYFYWLLAGLSAFSFFAYLYVSRSYIYNKATVI